MNKAYTKDLIKLTQGEDIQILKLRDALTAIATISSNDKEEKQANRFMSCTFPHMGLKVWYRKRKYRVIANAQVKTNTNFQPPQYTKVKNI